MQYPEAVCHNGVIVVVHHCKVQGCLKDVVGKSNQPVGKKQSK